MSNLRSPLKQLLDDLPLGEDELERRCSRVLATVEGRRLTRAWSSRIAAGVVAAVVAIAFVALERKHQDAGPLLLATHRGIAILESPAGTERTFAFDDGSSVALAPATSLDLLENDGQRFDLRLRAGRAEFDVKPSGPRRWIIECGATTIEVVGTRFVVQRSNGRVGVEVTRGAVLVRGPAVPNHVARLGAGERIAVPDEQAVPPEEKPSEVAPRLQPADAETALPQDRHAASLPRRAPSPSWQALAQSHRFAEAWALARPIAANASVDELFALADVAHHAGDHEAALQLLERIGHAAPADERGAIAAFMRGRILHDDLLSPARAAEALAQALSLGLPRGLQEDAYARLVEAYAAAGDLNAARAAAHEYRQRFPNGRWKDRIAGAVSP